MRVTDPVCGMVLESESAPAQSTYRGKTYYFCIEDCKETFDENPEAYVNTAEVTPPEEAEV